MAVPLWLCIPNKTSMLLDVSVFPPAVWVAIVAFLGAWVGSFLNVVVHRLPRMIIASESAAENSKPYNLLWPPSHCPACRAPVRIRHNIPIFGWLWLRGRCADCKTPISTRYLLLELAGAVIGGAATAHFGLVPEAFAAIVLLCALAALAVIDMEHFLLPDAIVLPLVWVGLLVNSVGLITGLESAVWGAAAGYVLLRVLAEAWQRLRGVEALGLGDCKLAAALGAWLGWPGLGVALFLAGLSTVVVGVLARRRAAELLPFGPGLAVGGMVTLFLGPETILAWNIRLWA